MKYFHCCYQAHVLLLLFEHEKEFIHSSGRTPSPLVDVLEERNRDDLDVSRYLVGVEEFAQIAGKHSYTAK